MKEESGWETVVGMEVHIELATLSKMFCRCSAEHFGKEPNTQVCPVCLGLPGALPVPNREAILKTVRLGLALGCKIARFSKFDRKNYFYPDLPKGYQISQYDIPLATGGVWQMAGGKKVGIRRVHQEEDTGKLIHETADGERVSLIDYNRSGVPLTEVVTEPDFGGVEEVVEFLKELQHLVRWIGVSEADMEKGSMRLEANISLRKKGRKQLPDYKVEVKNINSFRFLKQAIEFEVERQKQILERGEKVVQETRGYDADKGITFSQRGKEGEADYRYFPEPDIPPVVFEEAEVERWRVELPELPRDREERLKREYGLRPTYASLVSVSRAVAEYFDEAVRVGGEFGVSPEKIAGVIVNKRVEIEKVLPAKLIEALRGEKEKVDLSEEELERAISEVMKENAKAIGDYKKGKQGAIQFLVGQVMARTKGKAGAEEVRQRVEERLR